MVMRNRIGSVIISFAVAVFLIPTIAFGQVVLDASDAIGPPTSQPGDGLLGDFKDYPNDEDIVAFDDPTLSLPPIASFKSIVNLVNFIEASFTGPDPLDRYVVGADIVAEFPGLGVNNASIIRTGSFFADVDPFFGAETYRATLTGFINITTPGTYTFVLGHDDGAKLVIGGEQVILFDGLTDFRETEGTVEFKDPGCYPIVVDMFENFGAADIVLSWIPPGGERELVPTNVLISNKLPTCGNAAPSIATLWPPNHKFVPVSIVGVVDPDGGAVSIVIDSIFQDERVGFADDPAEPTGEGSGNTSPDATGVGSDTAMVRAERNGNPKTPGNGRVYHITFTATDDEGGSCSGTVTVCVPHDQAGETCVDDGPLFNSTAP